MQILKTKNIQGNIYFKAARMFEQSRNTNEKIIFQDLNFDKRFAFLVGPKDTIEKIQKKLLKHMQSYFDTTEWNAYRKAIKLFEEVEVALKEEQILPWLAEFIPLANNEYVQYTLDFRKLFQVFSTYHDLTLTDENIDRSSPFYTIIQSTLLDLSLAIPPSMHICELINQTNKETLCHS